MTERPLSTEDRLVDAVRAIESTFRRIAVVIGQDGRLNGTLTDGDIRRCLLAGGTLDSPVSQAMNLHPIACFEGAQDSFILELMRRGNIEAIPMLDADQRLLRIVHITDLPHQDVATAESRSGFVFAVIMAGGEGTRLRPITETIPKPMVDVGGAPLLEHLIRRLARAGIRRIYISVNYLGHVIESHFGDGSKFNVEISYLRENEKLGTGGALSLLPEKPTAPIVVMNGDILTMSDFASLYDFHVSHQAQITVAAVHYHVNIPFGVIQADEWRVQALVEKPSQRFLCNAGIYAVSPEALKLLPSSNFWNMTDLISSFLVNKDSVAVFPIHEYWSDVGTHDDLEKARAIIKATG